MQTGSHPLVNACTHVGRSSGFLHLDGQANTNTNKNRNRNRRTADSQTCRRKKGREKRKKMCMLVKSAVLSALCSVLSLSLPAPFFLFTSFCTSSCHNPTRTNAPIKFHSHSHESVDPHRDTDQTHHCPRLSESPSNELQHSDQRNAPSFINSKVFLHPCINLNKVTRVSQDQTVSLQMRRYIDPSIHPIRPSIHLLDFLLMAGGQGLLLQTRSCMSSLPAK